MVGESAPLLAQFAKRPFLILFECDRLVERVILFLGVARISDDSHLFPSDRQGAMLAPLNVDARAHPAGARVVDSHLAAFQYPPMKIGQDVFDRAFVRRIFHPDQFVVAGVVVFREIYVVFPEEMVSDQSLGGVEDDGEIFEREKFRRRGVKARSETASQTPLFGVRLARRVELESAGVFAAGVVEASTQVILDAALMMRFGGVRCGRNLLPCGDYEGEDQRQKNRVMKSYHWRRLDSAARVSKRRGRVIGPAAC